MGYEEKLADATAEAMADGDTEKVFANQKKHLENVEKKVRAEALKDTPKPTPDGDSKTMTLIYVALIVKGKRTYASVPAVLKEQVKEMLIDLELEDLITE